MSGNTKELHAHDKHLERAILHAYHVWPWLHEEPAGVFPTEAFYLETHRTIWLTQTRTHRERGNYPPGAIIDALRAAGKHDDAAYYADICVGANVDDDTWPASFIEFAISALLAYYVRRQRAIAIGEYESACLKGDDETQARLMLEMHLDGIDSMRLTDSTPTDDEIADMLASGSTRATGITALDALSGGLASPGFNVLAARPSVGKSALARAIIRERAKHGDRVYWYSQDQSINQIYELEIARLTLMDSTAIKAATREERADLVRRVREDAWHDRVTVLDRPTKLSQLLGYARAHRPDLVVVDYVQIVDAGFDTEYENITATSKALKTLALQLRCPILGLAQYNRHAKKGDLDMAHIRGSGQIEQDADQIWALDRDTSISSQDRQEAVLHVLKNKVGATGNVGLVWLPQRASFELRASARQVQSAESARSWLGGN